MHKRTTEAIEYVLKHIEQTSNIFNRYKRITIIPNKNGGWFWKLEVVLNPRYKHLITHIEKLALRIGRYYGEGLYTNIKGRTIKVS